MIRFYRLTSPAHISMNATNKKIVIGFDLGGTTTTAGLVDGRLNVLEKIEVATNTVSQEALLQSIVELIEKLAAESPAPVAGIGFGIPSMIDQSRGRAVMSVNVPLDDLAFVDYMQKQSGLPVFIDNDANVAALAEARAGAGKGCREMVMVTVGTGIGGGIIIGGRVYRGATGSGAELGHMVIDVNGPKCPGACPNYGCFEVMASGTALKRYATEEALAEPDSLLGRAAAAGEDLNGALLSRLAAEEDKASLAVYRKLGFYLGVGITSLVNIFNPEVFVIGGGVINAGDLILDPVKEILMTRGLRPNRDIVEVKLAEFGAGAGLLGAASLALDEIGE